MDEHYKRCHDCGKFLKRSRWVIKDYACKRYALCEKCSAGYDMPDY